MKNDEFRMKKIIANTIGSFEAITTTTTLTIRTTTTITA
jgi:hypothetical protein